MKLDEKYFIPFIGIIAVVAALLIVFFTITNQTSREEAFQKKIMAQDSLKFQYMPVIGKDDSLKVTSFPQKYVVVDFWATWASSFTKQSHSQLQKLKEQYPDTLEVLAAVVEDKPKNINKYIARHKFPFHFVDGTKVFNKFYVPGVPTQLVYAPGGTLKSIFSGSADSTRLDSLQTLIGDGR